MPRRAGTGPAAGVVGGRNRCGQEEASGVLAASPSHRGVAFRGLAAELVLPVGEGPAATRTEC